MTKIPNLRVSNTKGTTLLFAGIVSAAFSWAALQPSISDSHFDDMKNPVVEKALRDSQKLQKAGKWKQSAELLKMHLRPLNPDVLLEYGKLQSRGWGLNRNLDKARENLLLAVQFDFKNRAQAAFELAHVYLQSSGEDCTRIAFEWFTKSAAWGFAKAHIELGRLHAQGIGVPVNEELALNEYRLASQFGFSYAYLSFIRSVSQSSELEKSLPPLTELMTELTSQLKHDAINGKASSAKTLGGLYLQGRLVAQDFDEAEFWFRRGADLGDSGAMTELAMLLLKGHPTSKQIAEALDLMGTAVEMNNAGALTEFGRLHLSGLYGLPKQKAVSLFELGISGSHPGAMWELAKLHLSGEMVPRDENRAKKLLMRGASLNHKGSKTLLKKLAVSTVEPTEFKKTTVSTIQEPEKNSITKTHYSKTVGMTLQQLKEISENKERASGTLKHPLSGATVITPFGRKG